MASRNNATAERQAEGPLGYLPNFDPPWLSLLHLLQRQSQHAVAQRRADLLLVDAMRQREGAREMADIVFGIERLHALVL